ncbi:MAG: hypothetical protein JW751_08675 [Polyangiaceae bacterium]|nr:hypothetical protein [Polyangiaceae bacterium]
MSERDWEAWLSELESSQSEQQENRVRAVLSGEAGEPLVASPHEDLPHDRLVRAYRASANASFVDGFPATVKSMLEKQTLLEQRPDVIFWLLRLVEELAFPQTRDPVLALAVRPDLDAVPSVGLDIHLQAVSTAFALELGLEPTLISRLWRDLPSERYGLLACAGLSALSPDSAALALSQLLAYWATRYPEAAVSPDCAESFAEAETGESATAPPDLDLGLELKLQLRAANECWPRRRIAARLARELLGMDPRVVRLFCSLMPALDPTDREMVRALCENCPLGEAERPPHCHRPSPAPRRPPSPTEGDLDAAPPSELRTRTHTDWYEETQQALAVLGLDPLDVDQSRDRYPVTPTQAEVLKSKGFGHLLSKRDRKPWFLSFLRTSTLPEHRRRPDDPRRFLHD